MHARESCIGCGSCVLLDPQHRSMDATDGKASLRGAHRKGTMYMVGVVDEDEVVSIEDATAACPMRIITLSRER